MKKYILLTTLLFALIMSCSKDSQECAFTYTNDIQPIIANTCAYAGCHSGATASPWVPATSKDYTTYSGLLTSLENGKLKERAIILGNMPDTAFVMPGHPKELTAEEKEKLSCWLDAGYPEN